MRLEQQGGKTSREFIKGDLVEIRGEIQMVVKTAAIGGAGFHVLKKKAANPVVLFYRDLKESYGFYGNIFE